MFRAVAFPTSLKFRRPEAIWLEPEQFEQALAGSLADPLVTALSNEADQWQLYLNALALSGFEQWLQQRTSAQIDQTQCINQVGAVYNLKVGHRTQDNYIQLKSFKGRSGILFSVVVTLDDICLRENFEL